MLLLVNQICMAQDPLQSEDSNKQKQWVSEKMKSMTIDEKIGQLFMVAVYSDKNNTHVSKIAKQVGKYHVGGVIFMKGSPQNQVRLNTILQAQAKIPLLVGFDGEWGLDMRLKNTYKFPWNMTLGAIQDEKLIEQLGQRIGKHCKRVGIHVNFAPVLDINTNPKNPIIGNRSFGEDKENVTAKAKAFIKGMQSQGVLANGKHFPGHGDTATDSHKTLPAVNFSKERIEKIELYPYKQLFKSGLASVMVAHLNVPSLEQNKNTPSSLSKNIVTNILKKQLAYKGLIFTDGMGMGGVTKVGKPTEVNLKAFLAGNDILLIPSEVEKTMELFKKSIKNGTLSMSRLDESVEKILKAKYLVGLHNYQPIKTTNILTDLNTIEDEILHRKLVEKSLTLVQNKNDLVPIKQLNKHKIAYVKLGDDASKYFLKTLKKYTKIDEISKNHLHKLKKYDLVIIGFHKFNENPWKSYKFSVKDLQLLKKIAQKKKVILDVFTSPYALLQLTSFENIESILVSYQNSEIAQKLSAQAIFGAFEIDGKLPVSINKFKVGTGIKTSSLERLSYGIPEEVGMSSDSLNKINLLANRVLKDKMAPGLQILVARHGKVIYQNAFGYQTLKKVKPVVNSDVYDLASLTKILATLPLVMKANEEEILSINSTIGELNPEFVGTNKENLKLKQVLSHYAGLEPWIPFYKLTQTEKGNNIPEYYSSSKTASFPIKVADHLYLNKIWKDSMATIIKNVDQLNRKRYKYSDLGYYILKGILENNYKKRIDKLADENFYKSLGMNRTSYLPLEKFNKNEIVPSEKDDYFRHQELRGYVHDMGAAMQGGVGGHAGLFANTNDVAKIMQMYLQNGTYGGIQYLKKSTLKKYNKRYYADVLNRRGLGFDKPQLNPREKPTCSCVSDESFGHSGFTGTYTWADPKTEILYVFLSNRTYPSMSNKALVKTGIRTKIQRVIQNAIIK